ncbi:MAG: DUF433 domain-containing protein [Dehalococcoidia bacterium]
MTTKELSEAEKLERVPGIIFADGPAGPRARIAGTGLEVWELVNAYLTLGEDPTRVADAFDWLKPEQIQAALDYYAAFPDEINGWFQLQDQCFKELFPAYSSTE